MAAVAERAGAECRVADYTEPGSGENRFIIDLTEFRPDLLVMSITSPSLHSDLSYCAAAKAVLPGLRIIAKGAHFLRFDSEVFNRYPALDMAVYGEAELTLEELLSGIDIRDIKGLIWRNGDMTVRNPARPFNMDLDALPFPARHLIDNSRYTRLDNGRPQGVIKVSRGCPHHCFFCLATPVSGSRVRMRSPGNIVSEIRESALRYGIHDFVFWSDLFNHDRRWVLELCRKIIDSGLKIRWAANARVNNIDDEMAHAMKMAGCELVSIGVESGNQEMLDRMGKGTTLVQIKNAFGIFRSAGIKTLAYFLFGLPWETEATAEDTIRFSRGLDSDLASFFAATPLPGTRFYEYAVKEGLVISEDGPDMAPCRSAYHHPSVCGHMLSADKVASYQKKAVRSFFLRPSYIFRSLAGVRSVDELRRYGRAALSVLR